MAKITPESIADLKALFQDNEKALGANFSQLIDFFNDNKVTDNGDGTYSVGDITLDARKLYNLIISGVTQQQLATKADDSKVVHTADMRKPANDVAGIEEVNAKQDKIGYTPADDSKVVHNSGAEEISGQKTFDVAPIDKTTGNPYITKADVTTKADTSAIDPSVLLGAIPITGTTDLFTLDPGIYFGKAVTPVNGPAINSLPATNYFWVKMETTKATASVKKLTWTDNGNNHYTNDYYGAPAKWHSWQVPNAGIMATKSDVTTAISTATANMADVSKTNTFSKQQIFSTNPTNGTQVYPIYATVDTDADATTLIASLQSSGFSGMIGVPES